MTPLLDQAIDQAKKLSAPEQDAIARLILDQIADDRAWDEAFARSGDALARLAAKVREDMAAGRVRSLRPPRS